MIRILMLFLISIVSHPYLSNGQAENSNRLKDKLALLKQQEAYQTDTTYINTLNQLATILADSNPDSALALLSHQIENCKKANYLEGEISARTSIGNAYQTKGNFEKALYQYEKAFTIASTNNIQKALPSILNNMGLVYTNQGDYTQALEKFYKALEISSSQKNKLFNAIVLNNIAIVHFYQGKMKEADSAYQLTLNIALELKDSIRAIYAYNNIGEVKMEQGDMTRALYYFHQASQLAILKNNTEMIVAITNNLGNAYLKKDSIPQALLEFEKALLLAKQKDYGLATSKALIGLAKVKSQQGLLNEALANGLQGLQKAQQMGQTQLQRDAHILLSGIYEKMGDGMNALKHFKFYMLYSDSLNNLANERAAANEKANYKISQNKIEFEKKSLQQRWLIFSSLAALLTLGIIVWIVNRNKKRLNQTNKLLQNRNELIKTQKLEVEETLSNLKSTQAQLIQSEKMASLGELTAGIAHEIQNPLNFVNNFSEVTNELVTELKSRNEKLKIEDEEIAGLLSDISSNLEKINHHGKRADSIVKGMLQHSRKSTGQKEPTDLNALSDEFLRLAYHGLRAKDKNFNALMKTDFDSTLPKVNVIPQDLSRVILNLVTNAFYAVHEKKLSMPAESGYEPTVTVSTKKLDNEVFISVKDNGNGIPQKVLDKIFQPFFTTKPAGKGTGLGLSMSYDIVTKLHGGQLKVESKEGEGAEFIISLTLK